MKRTLTAAAAVVASSAGAVGLAGTAAAVEAPRFPADVPVDGYATQMSIRQAQNHSTVPEGMVPADQQFAGKEIKPTGGGPLGGLLGGIQPLAGGPLGGSPLGGTPLGGSPAGGSPLGGMASGTTTSGSTTGENGPITGGGKSLSPTDVLQSLPVGQVVPAGQQLPTKARAGDPISSLIAGSPLGGLLGGAKPANSQQQQKPANTQEQKPSGSQEQKPSGSQDQKPAGSLEQKPDASAVRPTGSDPLNGVFGARPGGKTDQSSTSSPIGGPVGDVISQGPLGGVSNLSG
jgi:hypothetical protein